MDYVIFRVLLFYIFCSVAEARTLTCSKSNPDGSSSTFSCDTNCCGDLTARVCCPDMSDPDNHPKPTKSLSDERVTIVVTIVTICAVAVVAFSVFMWCRQNPSYCPTKPAQPSPTPEPTQAPASTRRHEYDTGISQGLGGQSAFPTRLHPNLFRGLRSEDGASMDPGFFSSEQGSEHFSLQGVRSSIDFA